MPCLVNFSPFYDAPSYYAHLTDKETEAQRGKETKVTRLAVSKWQNYD